MARTSTLKVENIPSITRETLNSAVKDVKYQYTDQHSTRQFIPDAVYLKEVPSYNDFFAKFLVPNQLCVLTENATKRWRSRQEWVCEDGSPNFDFLQHAFGSATVPVANCKQKEFFAHTKQEMKMSEFLTYWQQYREAGHPSADKSLYLKDWHFTRAFPEYKAYSTCIFFRSDWMNEFWDVREDIDDDYRFVYMGPKNTWTPFHADVFRSFSWSANICGRKRWIFFPPGEEEHLKDSYGSLVYDVTSKELEDPHKFPSAHKAQQKIEIIQHPGETIFVPSGWHHQVENLEDTISINHNWLNGCNVRQCWTHLKTSLADVEHEISDCRDMEGWDQQCQTILRALTGLDYDEFFCFMESVARRRIRALTFWNQRARNSSTCHNTCSWSRHDADIQLPTPVSSEACGFQTEDPADINKTPAERHRHEEDDVLDVSKGLGLNLQDPHLCHWRCCNVNHALFDLASVVMVLKDMWLHTSTKSQAEEHVTDTPQSEQCGDKSDPHVDVAKSDVDKENHHCSDQEKKETGSVTADSLKEKFCRFESLLQEINHCLTEFQMEGNWEV